MDISQITIPSRLFYSNSSTNQPNPRCLSQLDPSKIAMQMKLQKLKAKFKNDNKTTKSLIKKKIKPMKPQLGRIVKPKKTVKTKKILKEKNNNEKILTSPRISSPSYKFFKTKNVDSPSTHQYKFQSKISPSRHEQYSNLQFSSLESQEDEQETQTAQTIEALIGALGHDENEEQSKDSAVSCFSSLDGLIDTLEGEK